MTNGRRFDKPRPLLHPGQWVYNYADRNLTSVFFARQVFVGSVTGDSGVPALSRLTAVGQRVGSGC